MKEMHDFGDDSMDNEDISKHLELFNVSIDSKKIKQNYTKDLRYSTK